MKSLLSQAYHWPYKNRTYAIAHCLAIGFFTFSLCYWVRPFDLEEYIHPEKYFMQATVISFINMGVIGFINIYGVPLIIPAHFRHWTIGKELFWTSLVVISLCIVSPFFMEYFFRQNEEFQFQHYVNMCNWAFVGSTIPLIFSVLINHMRIQLIKANEIKFSLQQKQPLPDQKEDNKNSVKIQTEKGEYLLNLDTLIVIKSNANYSEIYYATSNSTSEQEKIRCTLTAIEKQLTQFSHLFRCHRTYIVNMQKVEKHTGSASKGYIISNSLIDFSIPVSRSKGKEFKEHEHFI